jgi:hypothetical protein
MPMDPIARLARLEELRRSGLPVGPESLSDGLEGADTPIAEDPEMSDADKEAMFQQQANRIKTDDYRRERMMYRAAKATGTPVEELMQQPEWSGVGEARADDAVMPMQARAAMAQKRMDGEAERMDRWKSQMLLASSNSRANMSNAFGMLSPEQQQRVIESRLSGNRYNNNDPRMAIAQLEAETRRAEGRDARASAAEIAEANRVAAREEREGVRAAEELKYNARAAEEKMKHDALMAQRDGEFKVMLAKMESGDTAAALRSKETLAGIQAQITNAEQTAKTRADADKYASDNRLEEARVTAGATEARLDATNNRLDKNEALAALQKRESEAIAMAGPGGADLMHGRLGLPAAQDALKELASQADRTWTGFHQADAARLDAMLVKIGITDPATRRDIVQNYGINASNYPGQPGRGSRFTSMFVSHPEYAPVPTAE